MDVDQFAEQIIDIALEKAEGERDYRMVAIGVLNDTWAAIRSKFMEKSQRTDYRIKQSRDKLQVGRTTIERVSRPEMLRGMTFDFVHIDEAVDSAVWTEVTALRRR